jgi:signal transduction histidine kinase
MADGPVVVDALERRFGDLPLGIWHRPPAQAFVVPITLQGRIRPAGVFIAAVNPFRLLDDGYRGFLRLLAGQIAAGLSNVRGFEEERRRAEALAELDRAKTTFFSNVSHEFRTPLTLMLGPTEDALSSPDRTLRGESLETVYRNELRLLKLVNTLLDFSTIEAGRMRAAFEPTDLASLTTDLASSFRSAFERAGLAFDVQCDAIPEAIAVDRAMWEKIVLNLLSNALKFTFQGGVDVRLSDLGDSVSLSVHDTGVGIAAADVSRIFDRFHRVEGARARTHEGSGIGLALVNDLVRLHGGVCEATSVPGEGTTLTVTIPKVHDGREPASIAAREQPAFSPRTNAYVSEALRWLPDASGPAEVERLPDEAVAIPADAPPGHILLADDNADMRDYVTRLLQRRWTVEAVADGATALESIRARRFDLLVSDVMMPGLDGFELLRAVRADSALATIPIMLLSARAGEEERVAGVDAGADDYLVKPFSARELVARVTALLRLSQTSRERDELLAREQEARRDAELQKQHLFSLFMAAPIPITVLRGPTHVVELANDMTCRLLGRRLEQLLGRPIGEAVPELRQQGFEMLLDGVFTSGETSIGHDIPAEFERPGSGPETFYFDYVYTPLRELHGEVAGILVVGNDVTAQVIARRDVDGLRAAAESANRAKDEFLAMLGHELRNPLAPILTALQLLKLRGIQAGERERDIIERQVRHLVSLVDDLLDVSRITRGKIELRRQPVEISDVVARAIEMASPLLEQQRHDLSVDVPSDGVIVDGDAARLAQVLSNLLTNAAKYTEPGGVISVTAVAEGGEVVLRVTDTGSGIEPEMLPRIFDLFVQQPQTLERSRGGLGLGLAIVRSLVELHGGGVSATSGGRGAGSEFAIRLPLAESALKRGEPVARLQLPRRRGRTTGRVLIVDDNRDAAATLAEMLAAFGYDTRFVHDGPSAFIVAEQFQPHIALLDLGLPVIDGFEVARRFAENPRLRRTRLVAVTGYGQVQDRAQSARAGFAAHLVKPVDVEQLRTVLDSMQDVTENV